MEGVVTIESVCASERARSATSGELVAVGGRYGEPSQPKGGGVVATKKSRKAAELQAVENSPAFRAALIADLKLRGVPAPDLLASIIIRDGISEACARLNAAVVLSYHAAVESCGNCQRVDNISAAFNQLPPAAPLRPPARSARRRGAKSLVTA